MNLKRSQEEFVGAFKNRPLRAHANKDHQFEEVVGSSQARESVLEQVELVDPTNSTVLIQGETGTGKELIAQAIHNISSRRGRRFVKLNCAPIPVDLLESALFGEFEEKMTSRKDLPCRRQFASLRKTSGLIGVGVLLVTLFAPLLASAQAPGQPFAPYWFRPPHDLNDLLTWTPASDPDAPFNRANTPLAARSFNRDFNVNSHAHPGEARVMSLVGFHVTSNNPSQGELSVDYYAVNYWQYMDVLVFFGGSSSEGLILEPNPTVIDAAHRNGVPVLGNIFFPNSDHIDWVRLLVQQSGSSFPAADKLIEIAHHYGFDGWFINQESTGGNADDATQVRRFMQYMKASSDLIVDWYDAMNTTGGVGYQNQLNDLNAPFLQEGDTITSDGMFLNYGWNAVLLSNSRNKAQDLGRDPYDVYAGVNVQSNGYNSFVNWGALFA